MLQVLVSSSSSVKRSTVIEPRTRAAPSWQRSQRDTCPAGCRSSNWRARRLGKRFTTGFISAVTPPAAQPAHCRFDPQNSGNDTVAFHEVSSTNHRSPGACRQDRAASSNSGVNRPAKLDLGAGTRTRRRRIASACCPAVRLTTRRHPTRLRCPPSDIQG